MNLRWLEDFIALCETRSFTEAAQRRFLTQSALSKHIQSLETWLGSGSLLDRSTNPIGITPIGESFLNTAVQVTALLNSSRLAVSTASTGAEDIYVSATHSLSSTYVPLLSKLLYEEPTAKHVCLNVTAGNFREALAQYNNAECDYFLCYSSSVFKLEIDCAHHARLTLGADYLVPVSVPATQGKQPYYALTHISDRPLPYLAYAEESHLGRVLQNHVASARLASKLIVRAKSSYAETLRAGVLTGLGLAWLPYSLVRGNLNSGDLVIATDNTDFYIPLTIDIYRHKDAPREQIIKCWDIWQTHVESISRLMPNLQSFRNQLQNISNVSARAGDPARELGATQSSLRSFVG